MRVSALAAGRAGSSCQPMPILMLRLKRNWQPSTAYRRRPDARLACQAHLLGRAVSVRRVYPAFVDAEAAREPSSWLDEIESDLETVP